MECGLERTAQPLRLQLLLAVFCVLECTCLDSAMSSTSFLFPDVRAFLSCSSDR